MKKTIFLGILLVGLAAILTAFSNKSAPIYVESDVLSSELLDDKFPEDVSKTLKDHCVGCHSSESKNVKSKGKLNFDKWENLSMMKKTGKLNDIIKTVKEGKMPPKKFVTKYPDKKLSEDQAKQIIDWAQKTMDSFKD